MNEPITAKQNTARMIHTAGRASKAGEASEGSVMGQLGRQAKRGRDARAFGTRIVW